MLKPIQFRSVIPRRSVRTPIAPQNFQQRCRRMQSTPPKEPPVPPTESSPPGSREIPLQPTLHRPRFERGPSEQHVLPPPESGSFHPSVAGFLAGGMFAFAISYVLYHFSGTYHVRKASEFNRHMLVTEQNRLLGVPDLKKQIKGEEQLPEMTTTEALEWLRRCAMHYTAFMPNSSIFIQERWKEVERVMAEGGVNGHKQALVIVKECAEEMRRDTNDGAIGWYNGKTAWMILRKHVDRIANLGRTEISEKEKKERLGPL